ncbi:hypothetical protein CPI43_03380 [Moraxella catarrhalis]|jgi:conjugal transfer pilus assembly protein TraB|uniref:TrbI/VirB10 family protein n=1 Tax=Moraxella catarrhalis TaxID=480 RepID=UPI00128C7F0A|nr:TrbI/VirB10 family protein [Moraxella catarrhalis]MPX16883.1 hypothetical protein [Moraxella catarrhalis]
MSAVDKNDERRKKQFILAGTAGGLLLIVGLGSIFLMDSGAEEEAIEVQTVELQPVGGIEHEDAWRRSVAEEDGMRQIQMEELQAELDATRENNAAILEQMNALSTQIAEIQSRPVQEVVREVSVSTPVPSVSYTPTPAATPATPSYTNPVLPTPVADPVTGATSTTPVEGYTPPAPTPREPRKLEIITFENKNGGAGGAKPVSEDNTLIPTASFVAATLLNGADAPTGGQAQSNPLPIVLQVKNPANLPNGYKANIKNCRFLAAAWGDLSSERMFARIETLSCIINGKSYEMPAKGYLVGEDGKTGMRGRVVSKKGKLLGMSFLSGVVSATGSVASSIGSTQTSIGGLSTSTVRGSDAARTAIGGGISEGSNTLAEYYREQAERLFDVIEVDAGRAPEVLITSPIEFPAGIKLRK